MLLTPEASVTVSVSVTVAGDDETSTEVGEPDKLERVGPSDSADVLTIVILAPLEEDVLKLVEFPHISVQNLVPM